MDEIKFRAPATITLAGASFSGKSSFLRKLIVSDVFDVPINKVYYCYGTWTSDYEKLPSSVTLVSGLPDDFSFMYGGDNSGQRRHNLVCFDDLQDKIDDRVVQIFTTLSHHKNLSCVLVLQNLYLDTKQARNIAKNCHYTVLFRNPRAVSQYRILGTQTGTRHLLAAYEDVIKSDKFGYLVVDLSPYSEQRLRLRTRIFPGEDCIVYK